MIYPVSWDLELQVKDHLHRNRTRFAAPCKQERELDLTRLARERAPPRKNLAKGT